MPGLFEMALKRFIKLDGFLRVGYMEGCLVLAFVIG